MLEDNCLKLADPVFLQTPSAPSLFKLMWLDEIINKTNFIYLERHLMAKSSLGYRYFYLSSLLILTIKWCENIIEIFARIDEFSIQFNQFLIEVIFRLVYYLFLGCYFIVLFGFAELSRSIVCKYHSIQRDPFYDTAQKAYFISWTI